VGDDASIPESVRQRAEALRAEIDRHNELYYSQAQPEISDQAFDALLAELLNLESKHAGLATPDSPTQRVGGRPLESFATVTHRLPMLSMDNTYSLDELRAFDDRVVKLLKGEKPSYTAEPKIDGVSISLTYEQGVLMLGATRGDGARGDDVTANIRTIRALPLRLPVSAPPILEVRGEVFFAKKDFARINEQRDEIGEIPFANPRNAAAGTLKMLDTREVARRPLRVLVYAIGYSQGIDVGNQVAALEQLRQLGLPVVDGVRDFDQIDDLLGYVEEWESRRHGLAYEVDGMVIKVADFRHREILGFTSKSPRWQVAYKYAAEQAVTQLVAIEVNVGKTGKLTPVAHLTPVALSGTTVSRASLHNDEEIKRKDVRLGDWVVVEKAGEIIPQIVEVKTERRTGEEVPFAFPEHCPACQSRVERDAGGVYVRCLNPNCPAQVQNLVESFARRHAMDIEGLGPAMVKQLYDSGLVRRLSDLYRLEAGQLTDLERVGRKSAANLVEAIQGSKDRGLARLLVGLGIRHVGTRGAEILAGHFGSIDELMAADPETLATIDEVGPVVAQSVFDYFHNQGGQALVEELRALGLKLTEPKTIRRGGTGPLAGMTIVVTGKLEHYSREGISQRIKDAGGKSGSSVSKKTDFVLVGGKPGSKFDDAQRLGIRVVNEDEFRVMVGDA
jgi:DNA ligase (NAD+)